jgi:mannose-1-phosphate guanylyltransferase
VKAVLLVGGEGTRLRPLTETIPKPLLPLMDRSFLHHVLDHVVAHGVHEVVLSSSYLEEAFASFLDERLADPTVTWITEPEPLGTGGAILNALQHVGEGTFLVLNGDTLTDLDLTAMLRFHRDRDAAATIALTAVDDARPYGLVRTDRPGRVLEFREKPSDPVSGMVNAGTYVLEAGAISGFSRAGPVSVEREVLPGLIDRGAPVYGFASHAYWMDLGTPEKYLRAHFDILEGRVEGMRYPAPFSAATARVDLEAHLGRWVVAGAGTVIEAEAQVEDTVLQRGARVGRGAMVRGSVIGPRAEVDDGARVTNSVLAEGARVPPGAAIEDARISAGQVAATSR